MRKIVFLLLTAFVVFSCSRSVEGEKANWEANEKKMNDLSALYPGFKSAIEEQKKLAKAKFDEASKASKEEDKIKIMAEANALANAQFISDLNGYKSRVDDLKKKMIDLEGTKMSEEDRNSASLAISDARSMVSRSEGTLRTGAQTPNDANAIVASVMTDLKNAEDNIKRVLDNVTKKTNQETADKEKEKKELEDAKKKEEAAKFVKCDYCGNTSESTATSCKSCGAALKK